MEVRRVVGIGCSAGGLEALQELFQSVSDVTGSAFVVLQHHPSSMKSLLDEILSRHTAMKVTRLNDTCTLEPNCVYVLPAQSDLEFISDTVVSVKKKGNISGTIDDFFRALAVGAKNKACGVVLSGSGSDGARGVLAIKQAGGQVMVQSRETSLFDGMPNSALATGVAEFTGSPTEIALELSGSLAVPEDLIVTEPSNAFSEREHVIELLRTAFGISFDDYRTSTIDRRIARRMGVHGISESSDYIRLLSDNPEELNSLYEDLLIGVTRFFRDKEAFEFIEEKVVPDLVEQARTKGKEQIRVWVPGCATGEEAYSLAILIKKYLDENQITNISFKVFASDLHPKSLDRAASGTFSVDSVLEIPEEIKRQYFVREGDHYRAGLSIRSSIVFCKHDLISDPPFTKIDLVSCRNLLIYFNPSLQGKINTLLSFSLTQGGFLFLGPTESVLVEENGYEELSSKWRVFKKIRKPKYDLKALNLISAQLSTSSITDSRLGLMLGDKEKRLSANYGALLDIFIESGILMDEFKNILHIFGDAGCILQFRAGPAERVLDRMSDERTNRAISAAMFKASKTLEPVTVADVPTSDGEQRTLVVIPFEVKGQKSLNFFVAVRKEIEKIQPRSVFSAAQPIAGDGALEEQLRSTQERLQASNEELETSNEELQVANEELMAANEEMQSTNEELQSTNEELQNTNEELHSVNAELTSVNIQLQEKIIEHSKLSSQVDTILAESGVACIVLDNNLEVTRFSGTSSNIINILEQDIGRPLSHISTQLEIGSQELVCFAASVLGSGKRVERSVRSVNGSIFTLRGVPVHITGSDEPGVLICFIDITQLVKLESQVSSRDEALRAERVFSARTLHAVEAEFQSPVRHVSWLLEQALQSEGLDDNLKDILNKAKSESDRLQVDLSALKSLRETSASPLTYGSMDLPLIITEAQSDSRPSIEIKVDPRFLPQVSCDKEKIKKVFSVIFNRCEQISKVTDEKASVVVDARDLGRLCEISVTLVCTHGAPLEVFKDDLFLVFSGESESTQMMMAKNIVESHGGQIWYDRLPGIGGRFCFTLPVAEAVEVAV